MNVLILADYRTPKSGNFIASILDLGIEMRKKQNKMIYLFPKNRENGYSWCKWIEEKGFKVVLFDDTQSEKVKLKKLKSIVNKYEINVIHSHFGYLHKLLLLQHSVIGKHIKILFHDHMDFSEKLSVRKQKLNIIKNSLLYRIFDTYVISVMQKKDHSYWLAGKKRHWYVPNGLSLHRAERDNRSQEEIRAEIGLDCNEQMALFLGWDLHRKGLDIAIKGIKKYREKNANLKLGVIGAGHGKPYERTQIFLKENGCDPNENWIVYLNDYEDIFALNKAIDLYISASRAEAFSYGILEAISQNNPVVVSDIEGTSWSWQYNKCVVFKNEDADACAIALKKAVELGKRSSNYQEIIKKYSSQIWCEKIMDIYKEIMK